MVRDWPMFSASEEKIRGRLETASREYARAKNYDYIVINDDADIAAGELDAIITAELCRGKKRLDFIVEGDYPL